MAAVLLPLAISAALSAGSAGVQYLIARKQKRTPIDRGRNDDLRVMGSDYGAIIPKIYGRVRLAPQILYSTGIRAVVTETTERTSGGKGGGASRQTVRNYNYYTTLFLGACQGEIQSIPKIWANSDVIYNLEPDPNLHYYEGEAGTRTGGASITADAGCSSGNKVTGIGSGGTLEFAGLPSPSTPTDTSTNAYTILTVYYKSASNRDLYVAVNGGTPVAHAFPASASAVQTQTIYLDGVHPSSIKFSNAGASAPDIDRISIWYSYLNTIPEDIPVTGIYDEYMDYPQERYYPQAYYNYQPVANVSTGISTFSTVNTQGVRIYLGTETQTPDSAIVAHLDTRYGVGQGTNYASGYRGIAGVCLEDYLIPNGNLPNFTLEVNEGTTSVSSIITDLHALKGISGAYLDLSAISALSISGIIINQLQPPEDTIKRLEDWFNFKLVEMDGKRKAVLLNQPPVATLTTDDLRAHSYGEEIPMFDDEILTVSEESLPRRIWVASLNRNPDLDYKNEAVPAAYFASTQAQDEIYETYPFITDPVENAAIAEMKLRRSHLSGRTHKFSAMPEFIRYAPGDVLELELDNATHYVEVTKKQSSVFGEVVFDGVDSEEVLVSANVNDLTASPDILVDSAKFPANTELIVFESIPIDLTHTGLGVYAGVSRNGLGKWQGCSLYNRIDTNGDWLFSQNIETFSPVGVAQGTLGNHATTAIDTANTLTIYFYENVTLETFTAGEILANPLLNLIRVGNEWLQFRTATSQTLPNGSYYRSAWQISNLTRGTYQTTDKRATHTSSEDCVVYSSALKFIPFIDPIYNGASVQFTAATFGQSTDLSEIKTLTVGGLSLERTPPAVTSITLTEEILSPNDYTKVTSVFGEVVFTSFAYEQLGKVYWKKPGGVYEHFTDIVPDASDIAQFRAVNLQVGTHYFKIQTFSEYGASDATLAVEQSIVITALPLSVADKPVEDAVDRVFTGFDANGQYRGQDTAIVPLSVITASVTKSVVFDNALKVDLNVVGLITDAKVSQASQGDSIFQSQVVVYNKFGELITTFTDGFTGAGTLGKGTIFRKDTDPLEEAIFKITVRNYHGWSLPKYLKAQSVSDSMPTLLTRANVVTDLTGTPISSSSVRFAGTFTFGANTLKLQKRNVGETSSDWVDHATGITSLPYTATGLAENLQLEFRMVSSANSTYVSNIVRATTYAQAQSAPTYPAPISLSGAPDATSPTTELDFSFISKGNVPTEVWVNGADVGSDVSAVAVDGVATFTRTSLTPNTAYLVKVRHDYGSGNYSDFTPEISVSTDATPPSETAPTITSVTYSTSTQLVTVAWTAGTGGSGNYTVEWATTEGGSYTALSTISASPKTHSVAQTGSTQILWYRVKQSAGYSTSVQVSIPAVDAAQAPSNLQVEQTSDGAPFDVTFDTNGATGTYILQISPNNSDWFLAISGVTSPTTHTPDSAGFWWYRVYNTSVPGVYAISGKVRWWV